MENIEVPDVHDDMLSFVVRIGKNQNLIPRLGQLTIRGRSSIPTPNYVACTSRGVLPHVAQDVLNKHSNISIIYHGLEDFIEKKLPNAPLFQEPNTPKLKNYASIPDRCISILGPRRIPRIECPSQNTNSTVAISTSVGFGVLEVEDYITSASELEPDIVTSIVDLVNADRISAKRIEKSADRTHAWLRDTIRISQEQHLSRPSLFASIPPVEPERQSFYLSDLGEEFKDQIAGFCLYDRTTITSIPESLASLIRLCLSDPTAPEDVLEAVSLGTDLITVPFVTRASETGIALSFSFPAPENLENDSLGENLWDPKYATDLSPLTKSCTCYTCTRHHRAYVHHLLSVKEMLAWTLLQIHNFHVIDEFFAGIREAVANGHFDSAAKDFRHSYQRELPKSDGEGPRIRGYQTKSVGRGEPKKNTKAYGRLDDQAMKLAEAGSGIATPEGDSEMLEKAGLGERTDGVN